jgi:hypothetical protein
MKDFHNYPLFKKGLVFLVIILPLVSVVSTVLIFSNDKLVFDPSSNGFNNFLDFFKFPISLMAAFLASLTIHFTIKRINQTDNQLNILSDNNRFNNYYKFNEEFKKHFEGQELFSLYKKTFPSNSDSEINNNLQSLFKYFYGDNHSVFTTRILPNELQKVIEYLTKIDSCQLNKPDYNLTSMDYNTLSSISVCNLDILKSLIQPLSEKLIAPIYTNLHLPVDHMNEIDRHYLLLNELLLSVSFYESLLIFDGQKISSFSNLRNNYLKYLVDIKLK